MVSCSDAGGNELRLAASCKPQDQTRSQASLSVICDTGLWIYKGRFTASCVYRIHEPVAEQDAEHKVHVLRTYNRVNQSMRYDTDMTRISLLQCQCRLILPHGAGHEWRLVMRATVLLCVVHYGVHESSHAL